MKSKGERNTEKKVREAYLRHRENVNFSVGVKEAIRRAASDLGYTDDYVRAVLGFNR